MDDIRKGVCPLCRHNEVLESPVSGFNVGVLTLFTCRECGFSQLFAAEPKAVRIDQVYGAKRIITGPASEGRPVRK
jgi:hypothetical protein